MQTITLSIKENHSMKFSQKITMLLAFSVLIQCQSSCQRSPHPSKWSDQEMNEWFDSRQYLNGLEILPDPSIDHHRFAEHYFGHKEIWDKAFAFLKDTDFVQIPLGRIELGDGLFATVSEYFPSDREGAVFEAHKKYIDIQYVISGNELMDHAFLENMTITQPYDSDNDAAFGVVAEFTEMKSSPERFFIFFPTDAHRSVLKNGNENMLIRKVVVKVPVESDMEK